MNKFKINMDSFHIVLAIIMAVMAIFFLASCEKEPEKYSTSCYELWKSSAGTEFNMELGVETVKPMPNSYIYRCCELIDGGDSPGDQSSAEGACMVELMVIVEADKRSAQAQ